MSDMEATVARLTDERDRAREECGYEKAMRAHQRDELMQHFGKRREAEATIARVEALAERLWEEAGEVEEGHIVCLTYRHIVSQIREALEAHDA